MDNVFLISSCNIQQILTLYFLKFLSHLTSYINDKILFVQGLEFSVRVAKKSGGEGARFTRSFAANSAGKVSDNRPVMSMSRLDTELFLARSTHEVAIVNV